MIETNPTFLKSHLSTLLSEKIPCGLSLGRTASDLPFALRSPSPRTSRIRLSVLHMANCLSRPSSALEKWGMASPTSRAASVSPPPSAPSLAFLLAASSSCSLAFLSSSSFALCRRVLFHEVDISSL